MDCPEQSSHLWINLLVESWLAQLGYSAMSERLGTSEKPTTFGMIW